MDYAAFFVQICWNPTFLLHLNFTSVDTSIVNITRKVENEPWERFSGRLKKQKGKVES